MTHARRSTARPHRTALRGRLAALLALTIALAGGGTAPAAVAAPGDLGVSIDFVSADSPFAPIDSLAATILSGDSNAGANNYNFRYNVGYTCGPVACTDVEIHIAPQPLDPAYSYYRFAVYQSTSLPAGATIAPGGSATAGYTIRLGDLAPSTSGSFQMLYRYQQRQPGSDPASFFPDGTAIPATATISAAGLDPVTASDSIVWHIVTPDPGVRIVAGNARIGVPYTYTYYMSAGCQWVRSTAGHGEPGKLCAADYLVTAQLPAGAVIQSASDGGIVDPVANTVTWSAAGRGAAIGWGPLNSLGSPRTVTVVFPEASVPSDPGACIIDASTTLTADLTYLDGAAKSATTTATNLVNACEPFALASLDYKDTTTSNSSANLVAPNGNSTGTVLGGTSGNYWEVQVSNRSNVPGVATIVDEDLEQADLPVYRIWTDAGPADFRFTLEDVVSGDRTDAEALGVSNYQAPAGTRIVAATVVTAPIAGPNLEASSTPNRVSAHVRFYYTVPADAAVPLQGFSRTNTVSASMQYPDTGLADLDLGTRTGTVTVAPRPARFSATLSRTSAGGDPVPGDLVTFGGRGTSSSIRGGAVIEPQYVFAAPAGWTIDSVAALPPGVTAGPIHAVTIAGVVRQVVVFEIDPAAMSPAVADMNQAWPLVSVVATPTPAVVAGSASRADLYFTDASNTFNETNAGFVSGVVDADDLDGDGLTDERYANANASVRIGVISGIVVTKEICTGPGTDEGCVWSATSGSSVAVPPTATDIRYRVTLQNGPTPLTNVVAYDVLPHPGDHGLLPGGAPRGSTFAEEVTSITADPGVLLAYSASTEPCRTVDPALVEPACTDDWDEPTTEMLAIRATVASLAAGQQVRFSYAAAVLGSPAAGARACNAVAVVATGLSATETAPVCAEIVSADLAISVPDRLPLQEDRAGLVPFDVVNNGGTDGAPGTVEIEVPLGVTVTSLDPEGWTCDTAGGATAPLEGPAVLACTPVPGTLPLGAPLRLELPVIPDVIADELCFPAHVAGTLHDPVPANNDADACFASLPWAPGIAISKDDGRAAAAVGDELTYTIRVSNLLVAETLGGAVVTDTLPDGLVFVAADHGGTVSGQNPVDAYGDQTGGTVTWTLPDLGPTGTPGPDGADGAGAAGSALDLTVTVRVSPLADDDLVNLAEVSVPDPADTATTLGDESSDTDGLRLLGIAKQSSAPVSGVDSGDVVEYRILLANVGTAAFDASAPATIVDDLGEVLDDATLVPGSVQLSVDAGTPVALADPAGGLLEWSGPLPVGSTAVLSYRVQVRDDGDGDHELRNAAFVGDPTACDPATGRDENGLACAVIADAFAPTISKSVASFSQGDDGLWTVVYGVDVANPSPQAADYELTDRLAFGPGIGIVSAALTTAPGGVATTPWTGDGALATAALLPAGATHHYEVTVVADAGVVPGTPSAMCVAGEALGFANTASLTLSGGRVIAAEACAEPVEPAVRKELDGVPVKGDDGLWSVAYLVTVSNDAAEPAGGLAYTLRDELTMPAGVVVESLTVTPPAGVTANAAFTAGLLEMAGAAVAADPELIDGAARIPPATAGIAAEQQYRVELRLAAPEGAVDPALLGCGAPGAGYGNRVALLAAGTVQGEATACADIELPEMRFTKTAEVADGTRAGDIVRYVITATNVGGADFTAGDPAQLVDDMSELLDDAVAVGPVVASGGIATVVDPGLHWSGPLPAGGTITVEYAVRLHAGGDGAIVNTVQRTGLADPVAAVPDCATTPLANDAPRCAVRLALTPSQLGATGPGEVWLLLGGAILLTLIGAPLVIVMMRDSRRPSRRR